MRVAFERGPEQRLGLPIPPETRQQGREVVVAHRRARREFNDLVKTRFGFLSSAKLVGGHPSHIVELRTRRILVERSEEHTSELQSLTNLVCRLLLEKKKTIC